MRLFKALLIVFVFSAVALAQFTAEDVKTFTLENGMKFLVVEDDTIPNVSFYLFFKVGSRNEVPGITGISHFFEHMMFNGAKKYGKGEFDAVQEAGGGRNNAYTSKNITAYTSWVPKDFLETQFDLEADRIRDLAFIDEVVESERGVVIAERITGLENSNYRLLSEQVNLAAISAHPYRWSVIGYESDIHNWSKQDLVNYHRTYYAPNNGICVITGDVKLDEVKALAKKYIEPIPAQEPPRKIHTKEPAQLGEKRLEVHKKVPTPHMMITYHVPETKHEDSAAIDLLNSVLSSGRTSRFYQTLVFDKQLAMHVEGGTDMCFDPYLYTVYTIASDPSKIDALEKGIYEILDDVKKNGVTADELTKAKNQAKMGFYRVMTTSAGLANTIGRFETFYGDYNKLFNAIEEMDKVTNEDIKRVAKKYFVKRSRTVGILRDQNVAEEE